MSKELSIIKYGKKKAISFHFNASFSFTELSLSIICFNKPNQLNLSIFHALAYIFPFIGTNIHLKPTKPLPPFQAESLLFIHVLPTQCFTSCVSLLAPSNTLWTRCYCIVMTYSCFPTIFWWTGILCLISHNSMVSKLLSSIQPDSSLF